MNTKEIKNNLERVGLNGWTDDWDIENIHSCVSELQPGQNYLEIGVAHGSSLAVASLAAKEGVGVYGIDVIDWGDRDWAIDNFLSFYDKRPNYKFIDEMSQVQAKYWNDPINVLYIDGDHTYEGVIKDMASWLPKVASGAVILFDDYNEKTGVKKAVDEILLNHNSFENFEVDGEMFICKKK